jgi:chromosomal replication initiation ATPase DnaA
MIAEQRAKSSVSPTDLPRKPFTKDDLVPLWKSAAHRYKVEGQEPLYQVMVKRELQQINDSIYFLEVDNALSKDRLERVMMDILAALRSQLQNYDLEITLDITSEQAEETKFMTGKDKFEKLARKNPNLAIFQTRFNLDIDF